MFLKIERVTAAVGLMLFAACGIADEIEPAEEGEAPESAISSPPMEMDDPGTPGRQGLEVNFVGTVARIGVEHGTESLLDANYGIGDRLQLKFERPYLTQGHDGVRSQRGLGATELGVKWRFIDRNGLEIAVYPQYTFNDAFTPVDEEGQPEEKEGHSSYFPLLVSKCLDRVYSLGLNLGYRHNFENSELDDTVLALGAGRALGGESRVLTEIFSERDRDLNNRQTDVRLGYVRTLFPQWLAKSRFEFPAYASLGHSIGRTEAGEPSTSFAFGVSVILKPRSQ